MNGRTTLAAVTLLAVAGLLALLFYFAWQSVQDLPGKRTLARASADAADPLPSNRRDPRRRDSTGPDGVRYVEGNGIVAQRVDGELERAPSAVVVEPPKAPEPERETYRLVVIRAAGLIDARSHRIALAYIDAPDPEATCTNRGGAAWPCGRRARTALRRLVRRRPIDCLDVGTRAGEGETVRVSLCEVAGTDLSRWLVEQGWARPTESAPEEWQSAYATARESGRGLFDRNAR